MRSGWRIPLLVLLALADPAHTDVLAAVPVGGGVAEGPSAARQVDSDWYDPFAGRLLVDIPDRTAPTGGGQHPHSLPQARADELVEGGSSPRRLACSQHISCPQDQFCNSLMKCADCSTCQYNENSFDSACPSDRCPLAPTMAKGDVTPPRLHWLFVDPVDVNVKTPGSTNPSQAVQSWVDIWFYVSDKGSGVSRAEFVFVPSSLTTGIRCRSFSSADLSQGTLKKGMFHNKFWFQTGDEGGLWRLWQVWLMDSASNYRQYQSSDLFMMQQRGDLNATFSVTSDLHKRCSEVASTTRKVDECSSHHASCYDATMPASGFKYAACQCDPGYYGDTFNCFENGRNYTNVDAQGTVVSPNDLPRPSENSPSPAGGQSDRDKADQQWVPSSPPIATPSPAPPVLPTYTGWTGADTRIATSIISAALVTFICFQCRRHIRRLKIRLGRRTSRDPRIHPATELQDFGLSPQSVVGLLGPDVQRRMMQQRQRLDQMQWVHDMRDRQRSQDPAAARRRHSEEQQFEQLQLQQILDAEEEINRLRGSMAMPGRMHRQLRMMAGRGSDALDRNLEREISRFILGTSLRLPAAPREPQEPPPVSLPEHLLLPGRVQDADLGEGQECAVCMEMRNGAEVTPCGHKDLCYGCAQHIWKSGGVCPMCRGKISSVKKSPAT